MQGLGIGMSIRNTIAILESRYECFTLGECKVVVVH